MDHGVWLCVLAVVVLGAPAEEVTEVPHAYRSAAVVVVDTVFSGTLWGPCQGRRLLRYCC